MTFRAEIEKLIKTRKAGYTEDVNNILSNYGTERETVKEYNGRQLLELLQNADDARSQQVLIKLDTNQNTLVISNKGKECSAFSVEGVRSIMYANFSSKSNGRYIGNKGLGFRSIINWADEISILTNNIKLNFSQKSSENIYKGLVAKEKREEIQEERKLSENETPMAILAIPEIEKGNNDDWTTTVAIQYKENFLDDIKNQIKVIKLEVLLFLNHLQSIETDIDTEKTILKNPVKEWRIKKSEGVVPTENLEDDKNSKYELKIAYNNQLTNNDNNYLFAYFLTKIKIDLPFIVHGTFELDSSRNQLIDNQKNKFIIKKLVAFIIKTALDLKQDEVNYQALNFLQYKHKNEVLEGLGFYKEIDKAIGEKEIYPCIDNKYRNKAGIVYSNNFSKFIVKNKFSDEIPYLLKFANDRQQTLLRELGLGGFNSINKDNIEEVNKKIEYNKVRADFIHHLIINKYQQELSLLTDKNNKLINFDDDIYEPATQDFSLPDYVHIRFINQKLFELIGKYDIPSDDWKEFVNLKPHNKVEILRKVIASTNEELKQEDAKTADLIKSMLNCLYENYSDSIKISDKNIQLLDQNQELQKAIDLYLSKTYPSGELTEELFGNIFKERDFLADISVYELGNDKQKIEDFFLWLGVNKNTRLDEYIGRCFDFSNSEHYKYPAKKIYLESFKKHNESNLNSSAITLFAKKEGESNYFPQNEVYYSGSVKLPKEYTNTLAIFDFPKKNVADVVSFFGVQDLSKIQPIISKKESSNNDKKFQAYFQTIKPYILAYRVKGLEDEKGKGEAKKLDKITIKLYQNITCQIGNKEYVLSDYDYLIDDEYLIKTPNLELENIRQEYYFYTVFGDILGLVFGLENTDKFKDCIKDSETNIKRDIKEHISNHTIDEARALLGIAGDFYNFWHKVYELLGRKYTNDHNNNLKLINQELELDIKDSQIKYDDLTHSDNAKIIINIFIKLRVEIESFNNGQTNKIDLSAYHQQKLKVFFIDHYHQFKKNLYQHCIDTSQLLGLLVEQYLAFAETMIQQQTPMIMKDWVDRLDNILQLNGRELLTHAGKISHKMALEKSGKEYKNFKFQQRAFEAEQSLQEIEADIRRLDGQDANA